LNTADTALDIDLGTTTFAPHLRSTNNTQTLDLASFADLETNIKPLDLVHVYFMLLHKVLQFPISWDARIGVNFQDISLAHVNFHPSGIAYLLICSGK
jgi:hypothetical protein